MRIQHKGKIKLGGKEITTEANQFDDGHWYVCINRTEYTFPSTTNNVKPVAMVAFALGKYIQKNYQTVNEYEQVQA